MSYRSEILENLRKSMSESSIDVLLIMPTDPHLGEYVPDHWRIIHWLTGFSGSVATIVITHNFAVLFTDSRYFIQARDQLKGSEYQFSEPIPGQDGLNDWLNENIKYGSSIGINGRTISVSRLRTFQSLLKSKQINFLTDIDFISELWVDRPPMVFTAAFDHPLAYCGKDRISKIEDVRNEMKKKGVNYHLLSSLDDIMWLLNIRGNDIKYSPLLTSFALIDEEQVLFFSEENMMPLKLARDFDSLGIIMLPYEDTAGMLSTLAIDELILINPETTSVALFNALPAGMKIKEEMSIPARLKAVKNKTEIESIGNAMIKDGVALTRFFHWIEQNAGMVPMSELSLSDMLRRFRSEQDNYLSPSFSTIVAFNGHGALPHYAVTSETDSVIGSEGILLIDSGGQYLDGTTDITRTIVIGTPNPQQKKDFTLVLKGHIDLALAKFPSGTKGYQLDILARKALWENGLSYGHGTGHGVGFCLNVHETPPSISPVAGIGSKYPIEPGMLLSNEPAVYREGEYGIRTENLILCYEDEETESGKFLKFETVSLCYIDKKLIDSNLLDQNELKWLNSYHSEVFAKLSPHLTDEEKIWLQEKTEELESN